MDRVVRVWQVPTDDPSKAHATHALALHTAPVTSVRAGQASSDGKKTLLTAGQDGLVGYWDFDPSVQDSTNGITEQDEDMPRSKKRRTAGGANTTGEKIVKVHPTLIMSGHIGQVSRAIFDNTSASRAVSFGQSDHSIRVWDLDMAGQEITSKRSDRAILDGTQLSTEAQIFASANADRSIAVWDLREENTIISLSLTDIVETAVKEDQDYRERFGKLEEIELDVIAISSHGQ
jgi:ribosome biogenesis protein YTM1